VQNTFFEVNLKLLFRQKRDDARCDEVYKALRIVIHLIFQCPLALRDDEAKDFYLTLSVFVTIPGSLPVAWDPL